MLRHFSANLIWQPLLAVLFIAIVLLVLSEFNSSEAVWAIGAGSLSSSCCLVFGTPKSISAESKNIICGYMIGAAIGSMVHFLLAHLLPLLAINFHHHANAFWVLAAITIGLVIIAMVIFDVLHPPAVGMALIVVLDVQDYKVIWIILVAAVILAGIHTLLKPHLKNLVN